MKLFDALTTPGILKSNTLAIYSKPNSDGIYTPNCPARFGDINLRQGHGEDREDDLNFFCLIQLYNNWIEVTGHRFESGGRLDRADCADGFLSDINKNKFSRQNAIVVGIVSNIEGDSIDLTLKEWEGDPIDPFGDDEGEPIDPLT